MILIKIGGGKGILDNLDNILKDFASIDEKKIIVHGANYEMSCVCKKMNIPEKIITSPSGFSSRHTDRETLDIFKMVYAGAANKRIVERLQKLGINAIGLSGVDGGLLRGARKPYVKSVEGDKIKLIRDDFTGNVEKVNVTLLNLLLENNYLPVICPPAISHDNFAINVDNDRIVGAICKEMPVDILISLIEAPGMLEDASDEKTLIKKIKLEEIENFSDFAKGRMKKKIHHAKEAFGNTLKKYIIADGRIERPITMALAGSGTAIE
ncbi:MAG: [LysW]-aminoadipate kinase [archaeon]